MISPIILVGGGGHCASCIDVIYSNPQYSIFGIIDIPDRIGEKVSGISVIGSDVDLIDVRNKCRSAIITIGYVKTPAVRKHLFTSLYEIGYELPEIIASTAYKSNSCTVDHGTILMHQSMVNAGARVGKNCIINSKALIEHDAVIGDNCHISTGAIVNGNCSIGEDCLIGSASVIKHGVTIVAGCLIGAGAVVVSNIEVPGVYVGNPARKIR